MDYADRKKIVLSTHTELLRQDRTGKGYICPICNSGAGNKGTGITTKDGIHYSCWTGCFKSADIFDIIGLEYGLADFKDQLEKCEDLLNIRVDKEPYLKAEPKQIKEPQAEKKPEEPEQDYTAYYEKCAANLCKTDYLKSRGITVGIAEAFKLGYDPKTERLIIPISKGLYKARAITEEQQPKYLIPKNAKAELFNLQSIKYAESDAAQSPIFIVEGELDAISIAEADALAIGLGSTSNADKLITYLKENKTNRPIILALDNDAAGKKATDKLTEAFKEMGITYHVIDLYRNYKDANEYLVSDREGFIKKIQSVNSKKELYKNIYTNKSKIQGFLNGISESVNTRVIKTGFNNLDNILEDGLTEGLYVLGAVSSIGKTTFLVQLADQLASNGNGVLFVSLEQAREELMAKSISRETLNVVDKENLNMRNAKTARGITTGERYAHYSPEEKTVIGVAIENYSKYADNIEVLQGTVSTGIKEIEAKVKAFTEGMGIAPVVIVDYLQLLCPLDKGYTDKMNVDKNVQALKQISRDYKTPVIVVSSLNRESYKESKNNTRSGRITNADFKDSGNIEYSADVLLAMQFCNAGKGDYEPEKELSKEVRQVQIVTLKQRNGRTFAKANFEYQTLFNTFADNGIEERKED